MTYLDLRSDTVTQPTQAMRDAMHCAVVGDDVFDDDPTVTQLERFAAQLLGKPAALFVTSGTQGNACAIMAHTRRGECIVIDPRSHIADHEAGSYAQLAGVSLRFPLSKHGVMDAESVRECITDDSDLQVARTGLVVVENAHSSGTVVPLETMRAVYDAAHGKGVPVHLDGARLFNAVAALRAPNAMELTQYCDTVMCCLSKGLCAPVGSILAGDATTIQRAKKVRKLLGGGLRQAGFLAAAGMLALREMTVRVGEDHHNAAHLGALLADIDGVTVLCDRLHMSMVFFCTDWGEEKAARYPAWMLAHGVKVTPRMGGEYRMVTHRDVTRADCETAARLLRAFCTQG